MSQETRGKPDSWETCLSLIFWIVFLTFIFTTRWKDWWQIAAVVLVSFVAFVLLGWICYPNSANQEREECKKEITDYEDQLLESIFEQEESTENVNVGPVPNRTYRLDASMPDLGLPSEGESRKQQRMVKWDLSFIPVVERGVSLFRVSGKGVDMNGRTNIVRGYCRANGSRVYWREDHLSLKGHQYIGNTWIVAPKPYLRTGSLDFAKGRFTGGTWRTEKERQGVYAREGMLQVLLSDDPTEQQQQQGGGGADRSSSYQPPSVQPASIEKESIELV